MPKCIMNNEKIFIQKGPRNNFTVDKEVNFVV